MDSMNSLQLALLAWAEATNNDRGPDTNMAIYGHVNANSEAWLFFSTLWNAVFYKLTKEEQVLALCFAVAAAGDE
jgi:hypothetical protein